MVRTLKSQKGFSLIELMIVVAIIGILATIAVPNFNKMQGRARQSEAKTSLSAMYSGQKAFYAEWSSYIGDIRDAGYVGEGVMNYVVGFAGDFNPGSSNLIRSTAGVRTGATLAAGSCTDTGKNAECNKGNFSQILLGAAPATSTTLYAANGAAGNCVAGVAPSNTTFTASANGYVSAAARTVGTSRFDVWAIDQDKNLCNTQDGLL